MVDMSTQSALRAASGRTLSDAGPLAQLRGGRLPLRLAQLTLGLVLYGVSMGLLVRSALGVMPWDVLHQGIARQVALSFGTIVVLASIVVLLLWVPLRQKPGLGTIANALLIGVAVDVTLALVSAPSAMVPRLALLIGGLLLNGVATAMYIGAQLGPGPRDGLMTGLARRTGWSIRLVRTGIEVLVVGVGWLLGGTVGLGTVLYALAIGPLAQLMLPWFTVPLRGEPAPPRSSTS